MKGLMIQGTSSDVGKSLIVTALCRILAMEGYKVAPFKSQNMSNNSYVTVDGHEIGRAQGIQAEAAKIEATVWMNPILLKPRSDMQSEVVVLGKVQATLSGRKYRKEFYEQGLEVIKQSLDHLKDNYDFVLMEGAGSPVEINLKDRELVNMKVAEMADIPVVLVADIDRGGVFASIVGTLALLTKEERNRVKGIIINKFRGDPSLFVDGVKWIEEYTNIPILGVLPFIDNHMIDSEDSLSIREKRGSSKETVDIAIYKNRYFSNFTDIEPFFQEEDVTLRFIESAEDFGHPDAVVLPGTKSTIDNLEEMKQTGLAAKIIQYVKNGGRIIGLCGGYQMLGTRLLDPDGMDSGTIHKEVEGLGIIPATTVFEQSKQTIQVEGGYHPETKLEGEELTGYEIHLGKTSYQDAEVSLPFLVMKDSSTEGYYTENGRIIGTYLHHLFFNDEFRSNWLNQIRKQKGYPIRSTLHLKRRKDKRFDQLAEQIKENLRWDVLQEIMLAGEAK